MPRWSRRRNAKKRRSAFKRWLNHPCYSDGTPMLSATEVAMITSFSRRELIKRGVTRRQLEQAALNAKQRIRQALTLNKPGAYLWVTEYQSDNEVSWLRFPKGP